MHSNRKHILVIHSSVTSSPGHSPDESQVTKFNLVHPHCHPQIPVISKVVQVPCLNNMHSALNVVERLNFIASSFNIQGEPDTLFHTCGSCNSNEEWSVVSFAPVLLYLFQCTNGITCKFTILQVAVISVKTMPRGTICRVTRSMKVWHTP